MAEWKILMISWGEGRMGRIINEYIRGKDREARLRWFGCVQSRDSGYIRRKMLDVGAVRQEINRKTSENVHGCNEEGPVEV